MPFIFCFWCFSIRALTDPEGTALPRDSQLLEMVKNLPESGASIHKPTNARLPYLPGCASPGHSPPALSPQSQAPGHWGQPGWPRACLSYSSQPIRNLRTGPRPFPPRKPPKGSVAQRPPLTPPASWPTPVLPLGSPHWAVVALFSQERRVTHCLFHGSLSLTCWPHQTRIIIKPPF